MPISSDRANLSGMKPATRNRLCCEEALIRPFFDGAVGMYKPVLACERFTGEPIRQPVRHQDRRKRPEICSRYIADRVTRFLIHHHLLGPAETLYQAM